MPIPPHLPHILLNPLHENRQIPLAALDALELGLPLAGHGGAFDVRVDDFDEADALVRRLQGLALAHDVLAAEESLDDLGSRGRRAEARLFHGLGKLLVVQGLAGRLHGREERRLGEALRRPGLLGHGAHVPHVLRLALGKARRQILVFLNRRGIGIPVVLLLVLAVLAVPFVPCLLLPLDIEHLPAHLIHQRAGAVIAVHDRLAYP